MNARSLGMKLVLVLVATTSMSGIAAADVDCTGEGTNLSLQLDDAGTVTLSLISGTGLESLGFASVFDQQLAEGRRIAVQVSGDFGQRSVR